MLPDTVYNRRYTEVGTEISQVSRKRGRGAVPPVRIEKAAFSPIDRSSRRWQLHREIGSHVGNGVGKLLSGMSAGLLTNRRKETTWEENIYGRASAGEKNIGRVMKSRDSFTLKIENIGLPVEFVTIFFPFFFFLATIEKRTIRRYDCINCSLRSFGKGLN